VTSGNGDFTMFGSAQKMLTYASYFHTFKITYIWRPIMKNLVILGIVLIVAVVALFPILSEKPVEIDNLLADAKKENKLVMLELSSTTCSTCRRMQPFLIDIADTYKDKLIIKTIHVDERTDIARMFQVTSVPTQIFIDKEGNQYFKHIGYFSKENIIAKFKEKGL